MGGEWEGREEEGCHYSGATGQRALVGNHHPIFLNIPYGRERSPPFVSKLKVLGLSDEDWGKRNTTVGQALVAQNRTVGDFSIQGNVTKAHSLVSQTARTAFNDLYTRRPKRGRTAQPLEKK